MSDKKRYLLFGLSGFVLGLLFVFNLFGILFLKQPQMIFMSGLILGFGLYSIGYRSKKLLLSVLIFIGGMFLSYIIETILIIQALRNWTLF